MSKIKSVKAREIIDSRGNPTVEVLCQLEGGASAVASVPSGASTGIHEAIELRDGDKVRFGGLGVQKAVNNVNTEINQLVAGKDFDQTTLDSAMIKLDGTENKSRLGANAILGVSMAFARAVATSQNIELYRYLGNLVGRSDFRLPHPMFNVINGGKHADSGLDLQEFMVVPVQFPDITTKIRAGAEIVKALGKILKKNGQSTSIGDEGGFAPKLATNEEALDLIEQAIREAGYSLEQVKIGMDVAASSFYEAGQYHLKVAGVPQQLDSKGMISWYKDLASKHPIISIEDGLAEDDWDGFRDLVTALGDKIKIVGDDLTVTNIKRIQTAIEKKSINAVLIKLNQIGTLTETVQAIEMTKKQGWIPFISHRSGETTDTFIADLVVGLSCEFIKTGSLVRGERVCKYNRLMEIEAGLAGR